MKRKLIIMLSVFVFSISVTFVDALIHPDYFVNLAL